MEAIILCGGKGSRLKPVISDRSKVMAPVKGKPFLALLLNWLRDQGVTKAVLAAGYQAKTIAESLPEIVPDDLQVTIVIEPEPLGTGGALINALDHTSADPVLVLNGDTYIDADLSAFRTFFVESRASAAMMACQMDDAVAFGKIECASNGAIVGFTEKGVSGSGLVNAGVYLFSRRLFDTRKPGGTCSLEHDLIPEWLDGRMVAMPVSSCLYDIGTPDSLEKARRCL